MRTPDLTADIVVVGGGPGGENLAQYAIEGTEQTAILIERELLGGECTYYACIPSKALLRPVEVAATAAHLRGLTEPKMELAQVLARRDRWVSDYDDEGQVEWTREQGIELVRGYARVSGEREVEVTGDDGAVTRVSARRHVVLAPGGVPIVPELYADVSPWGSRDATSLVEVPDRLIIVGGGVIACEAATWLAGLGSTVTMLVQDSGLLTRHEPFAGEHVAEALRAAGVRIEFDVEVAACERPDADDTGLGRIHGGPVRLTTSSGEFTADEILVATGRRPGLDDIGLERVGLTAEDVLAGRLPGWLHVLGDADGGPPLTHWGKYRARVLGEQLAAEVTGAPVGPVPASVPVPQVVFTDPQVASVGLTEKQARDAGRDVAVANVRIRSAVGVALLRDDADGTAQIVVDRGSRCLLGATFVGPEIGDVMHAATVAIVGGVPVHVLRHAVPSFPAPSEIWLRLLEALPRELRVPA